GQGDLLCSAVTGGFSASLQTALTLIVYEFVAALLKPTGRELREGELSKPDLATYIVIFLLLFLLVLLIVFYINCQLRGSFFASMPYDRSLREARSSYNGRSIPKQALAQKWCVEGPWCVLLGKTSGTQT
uniref:Uncharacterized protein n=1 Tax=Paramormyrops kingsleyae TaxID=1676925 RepID=A0A3B3T699_9TELE